MPVISLINLYHIVKIITGLFITLMRNSAKPCQQF